MKQGTLYMAPNTLGSEETHHIIPIEVAKKMTQARYFAVEEIKSARRLLRKLDREFPIDDSTFFILNKKTKPELLAEMLAPLAEGHDVIVLSEAGCPGIADPGAELVSLAHETNCFIEPLVGPSSILLGLIGSGFNGQNFRFSGYLPRERKERNKALKDMESIVKRTGETQIFMDTPFRNVHVLEDMYEILEPETKICVACNLTNLEGFIKTVKVKDFDSLPNKIDKQPAMFLMGK
ncbi:MAG: SAM-dependent methyltransferase [Crocinitomicaceae bacterium]